MMGGSGKVGGELGEGGGGEASEGRGVGGDGFVVVRPMMASLARG